MILNPAKNNVYDPFNFGCFEFAAFFNVVKFFQTVAIVAAAGMLSNENRMTLGGGLASIVLWVGRCKTLVYKVGSVQAQNIHSTGRHIFLFRIAERKFVIAPVLAQFIFELVPILI